MLPGGGSNIDIFRFLYLQADYQAGLPFSGSATHTLTAKITGQL